MDHIIIKKEIIKRLEKTNIFESNPLFIKILNYLVEAEEKGEVPKSTTIAIDLFDDNDTSSLPLDAHIRAQIHSLRKKLELYYLKEGRNDENKISIPKGKYKLVLEQLNAPNKKESVNKGKLFLWLSIPLLLISVGFNLFMIITSNTQALAPKSHSNPFFEKNDKIQIVLGERLLYREYSETLERFRYIYDSDRTMASSIYKIRNYIRKYPHLKVSNTTFGLTDPYLVNFVYESHLPVLDKGNMYQLSTTYEKVNSPVLFLGDIGGGNLGKLKHYFHLSNIRYPYVSNKKTGIEVVNGIDTTNFVNDISLDDEKRIDYFVVLRVKTEDEHSMLFLVHSSNLTKQYMLREFLKTSLYKEIESVFDGEVPSSFEAIFEVKGIGDVGVSHKIVYNRDITK